jgi:two-component system, OmpR family, sensor histidine kinase BaeS
MSFSMHSLTVKIALVVLVVSLFSVGLVALFSGWLTAREYDRLLVDQIQDRLVEQAALYYEQQGTWEGAMVAIDAGFEARRPRRGPEGREGNQLRAPLVLLDVEGCVIGPRDVEYTQGECLPAWQIAGGAPVRVADQTVGTVIQTGVMPLRDPTEEAFLTRLGRGLLWGAIGAGIVALLLGLALARNLTRPLRRLTDAIHAMAAGKLEQRVDITSHDEIGELADAFNSMSAQLAQLNQARRQMTADIAHELRNPLMVMTGYIEALRDGVLSPSPERFDMMHEEAQHLQRLVADLRTLSLADAGELALTPQVIDPSILLARIAEAYTPSAQMAEVKLAVQPTASVPDVTVDVERMVQVLANLVTNALRHTPAGGTVTLGAHGERGGVAITVTDTGEGIHPEVVPRIFDRFYRADKARSQSGDESGLGLAIVKSIIAGHGGTVDVRSEVDKGSTFTVHLPAA